MATRGFMSLSTTVYVADSASLDSYRSGLKLRCCPHCHQTGFLIGHGFLSGYRPTGHEEQKRGGRVFCSNRFRKRGCGQTFSVLFSFLLKRMMISAALLGAFIAKVLAGSTRKAAKESLRDSFSMTSAYRLWNRWQSLQPHLRHCLCQKVSPPSVAPSTTVLEESWLHLFAAFPQSPSGIAAFQEYFQKSFFPN